MNLWTKPIGDITYEDIEAFCAEKVPEGARLDYKDDWPGAKAARREKLSDLICAFANTLGGMILIGVDANTSDNTPQSIPGVPVQNGGSERAYDAGQSVYPPVMPEVSEAISLPGDSNRCVYVVRVHPSRFAPHAVDNTTRVYIRTGNRNSPVDLASVDRIEKMLARRDRWEDQRIDSIQKAISRYSALHGQDEVEHFYMWSSVAPLYVAGEIAGASECHEACKRRMGSGNRRYVDGGSLWIGSRDRENNRWNRMRSADRSGVFMDISTLAQGNIRQDDEPIFVEWAVSEIRRTCVDAAAFYASSLHGMIGPILVSCGFENARGVQAKQSGEFPDFQQGYQLDAGLYFDEVIDAASLAKVENFVYLTPFEHALASRISLAFGHPPKAVDQYRWTH
jgi:hypothetical protein